jgi:5'-3' exonuclease
MGIPSYYSYIMRNHSSIEKKELGEVDILLMDSNTLIYESYGEEAETNEVEGIEERIIIGVIKKIEEKIEKINPKEEAYVAFDGVASLGKVEQQRKRRHKSHVLARIYNKKEIWNKSAITPGTRFMNTLSDTLEKHFTEKKFKIKVIVSTSKESGEGEHKLFTYIRENDFKEKRIVISGLDSDLIMLGLINKEHTGNMYILREEVKENKRKEVKILDIGELKEKIENRISVLEYMLICMLLGNDYLPHMVGINVRRNGVEKLLETYERMKNIPEIEQEDINLLDLDWGSEL